MKFAIAATKPIFVNDELKEIKNVYYVYDNFTSEIWDEYGNPVKVVPFDKDLQWKKITPINEHFPGIKGPYINKLKIQLGLSCNFSCEYCSQRFVPHADQASFVLVDLFLSKIDNWLKYPPKTIEFWGGEPFVYWKTLKPLAEALREKYLFAKFLVITNGSVLTDEIIDWLDKLNFTVGISHDGPGQNVRGPDPFKDPIQREKLIKLFKLLLPKKKISINSMIHRENADRAAIQKYFEELLLPYGDFSIGEGGFIDVYDEGGKANIFKSHDEHIAFRRKSLEDLRDELITRFNIYGQRIKGWINSWGNLRNADTIGQKCGMDDPNTIAVDLKGNVLTCQNVSSISKAPNGQSHKIGHLDKLDEVKLNTSTHWKFREECSKCPVLQMCRGSCMFLQGEYFKLSCDAAYSDHIPFFAKAFEMVTGALPFAIQTIDDEYKLPPERSNLWGNHKNNPPLPQTRKEPVSQ